MWINTKNVIIKGLSSYDNNTWEEKGNLAQKCISKVFKRTNNVNKLTCLEEKSELSPTQPDRTKGIINNDQNQAIYKYFLKNIKRHTLSGPS